MYVFEDIFKKFWEYILYVVVLCCVLVWKFVKINGDEVMFVGLVYDLGVFYLMLCVVNFFELVNDKVELYVLFVGWYDSIGYVLFLVLGLLELILVVVQEYEVDCQIVELKLVFDVFYVVNKIVNWSVSWCDLELDGVVDILMFDMFFDVDMLVEIIVEFEEEVQFLKMVLGG